MLTADDAPLIRDARRGTLTTISAHDGRPRSVPFCFVLVENVIWSPLDQKPKVGSDPRDLARVRNLAADPRATILVDRWDEDWTQLWFVELSCAGRLMEPGADGHASAVEALRAKYPQYAGHDLERRPMLRFEIVDVVSWRAGRTDARHPDQPPRPAPGDAALRPQSPRPPR